MLLKTRGEKIMAFAASGFFVTLVLLGGLLQYHYGGDIFFRRVIAGLAGCL